MHQAQGLEYSLPSLSDMLVSAVAEVDGSPEMGIFLRKTAEAYMLFDPRAEFRKRERLGQFLVLHKELIPAALRVGFTDVHCWVPPEIETNFGGVLKHMSWTKALWPCYSRQLK
jgi:hypothetical protein